MIAPIDTAWTEEKALAHIQDAVGTHFDPQVVEVFLRMVHERHGSANRLTETAFS